LKDIQGHPTPAALLLSALDAISTRVDAVSGRVWCARCEWENRHAGATQLEAGIKTLPHTEDIAVARNFLVAIYNLL